MVSLFVCKILFMNLKEIMLFFSLVLFFVCNIKFLLFYLDLGFVLEIVIIFVKGEILILGIREGNVVLFLDG